jgi:hypothetical protein
MRSIDLKCVQRDAFEPSKIVPSGIECDVVLQHFNVLMDWNTYEGVKTGAIIVLSPLECIDEMVATVLDDDKMLQMKGKRLYENEGLARMLFVADGGTIVCGRTGILRATTVQFALRAGCQCKIEGHGSKHNIAVNLTSCGPCVALVRSSDGAITIFSSSMTEQGQALRILQTPSRPSLRSRVRAAMGAAMQDGRLDGALKCAFADCSHSTKSTDSSCSDVDSVSSSSSADIAWSSRSESVRSVSVPSSISSQCQDSTTVRNTLLQAATMFATLCTLYVTLQDRRLRSQSS